MARRRNRRSSPRPRRARRALPPLQLGQRGWIGLIAAALLVAYPPTRHALVRASQAVSDAVAHVRSAEARDREVHAFARQYGIDLELADAIERAARAERVDTKLAFRLVRIESAFNPRAVSPVGAIGLTQLMMPTAAELQPGITRERLYDPDTNLRLGFRYFRRLLRFYDGDVETALHAYNRGMGTVAKIRRRGGDPANGYADKVLGDPGASPVGPVSVDTLPLPPRRVDELAPSRMPAGL